MTRLELIGAIGHAIAEMEGFYLTPEQAKAQRVPHPTLAQRNANPGNIRAWRDKLRRPYAKTSGYVNFHLWAEDQRPNSTREDRVRLALQEGWRVLHVLIGQYLDGQYTKGKPPSALEMFQVYAPSADGNYPEKYARFVAVRLGIEPERRLLDLIANPGRSNP